jgi:hypothetical protein
MYFCTRGHCGQWTSFFFPPSRHRPRGPREKKNLTPNGSTGSSRFAHTLDFIILGARQTRKNHTSEHLHLPCSARRPSGLSFSFCVRVCAVQTLDCSQSVCVLPIPFQNTTTFRSSSRTANSNPVLTLQLSWLLAATHHKPSLTLTLSTYLPSRPFFPLSGFTSSCFFFPEDP